LQIEARQGLEGRRSRCEAMERVGSRGTPESPLKMASLPFLRTGFLAKTRGCFCKHLTRRPWRSMFWKNGKMFFEDVYVLQIKVPQEKMKNINSLANIGV